MNNETHINIEVLTQVNFLKVKIMYPTIRAVALLGDADIFFVKSHLN